MKRYCLVIMSFAFVLCFFQKSNAQQEVQVSQYMITPMLLNPSMSSVDDYWETNLSYRNQWVGVPGAPTTMYLSSQKTIGKPHFGRTHMADFHNWHGIGAVIMQDKIGAFENTKIQANYAYNIGLTPGKDFGYKHKDGLRLALGTTAGFVFYDVDKDILGKSQTSNEKNVYNERALKDGTYAMLSENGVSSLDMNFGATLYYRDQYYLGISSSQILQNEVELGPQSSLWRHYYINGKYKAEISETWFLIPSFLLKYVSGAPMSYDLSLQADYMDKIFFGTGYRHEDAVTFMAGYRLKWGEQIKDFRRDKHSYIVQVFYSYDLTLSALGDNNSSNVSNGSHEITIGFLLPPMFHERNAEDTWNRKGTNKLHKGKRK